MRGLFQDRVTVVTPAAAVTAEAETVIAFWKSLGSRVVEMSPEAHDQALAATSHVPHVVASALASATPAEYLELTAGGWRDTTRIAAAESGLWQQILDDNRLEVLAALDRVRGRIDEFRRALEARDGAGLERLLTMGRERRTSLSFAPTT